MVDEERIARLEALVDELEERTADHGKDHWPEGTDPVQVVNAVKMTAGAPTHEAPSGVVTYVQPDDEAYLNNDGATGWTLLATGSPGAPKGALYLVLAVSGDLTAERVMTAGLGIVGVDSGPGLTYVVSTADDEIVHDNLSGGGVTSAHHDKYTDGEARSAAAYVATVTFGWDPQSPQVFAP